MLGRPLLRAHGDERRRRESPRIFFFFFFAASAPEASRLNGGVGGFEIERGRRPRDEKGRDGTGTGARRFWLGVGSVGFRSSLMTCTGMGRGFVLPSAIRKGEKSWERIFIFWLDHGRRVWPGQCFYGFVVRVSWTAL
jgi:hypothetical protein